MLYPHRSRARQSHNHWPRLSGFPSICWLHSGSIRPLPSALWGSWSGRLHSRKHLKKGICRMQSCSIYCPSPLIKTNLSSHLMCLHFSFLLLLYFHRFAQPMHRHQELSASRRTKPALARCQMSWITSLHGPLGVTFAFVFYRWNCCLSWSSLIPCFGDSLTFLFVSCFNKSANKID